ncbi:MAG: hydrophobe/amphiphile efflux-3 (HAE3) family transporter [Methanospirillum sp.]
MHSPFILLARLINGHARVVAVLVAIVLAVSLYGMTLTRMDTSTYSYLDPNTPFGVSYDQYSSTFGTSLVVLLVESGDVYSLDQLRYVDSLEAEMRKVEHVRSVVSIADVIQAANHGSTPNSTADIVAIKEKVPPGVLSEYFKSGTLMLVDIVLDPGLSAEDGAMAVIAVQQVIADSDPPAGTTITQTGDLVFNMQTNVAMSLQAIILIVVAMVLLVIVLGLLFGYVNHRFVPVVMVGMGLVVTFGILGFSGILITMAAIGAFPILIGLGIDYAIQFHSRLEEEARRGSLAEAILATLENTGPAVLYALIACSMGFAALFLSPVPMIRNFAQVAIIGIVSCYLVSLIGIPVFARLISYRPKGVPADSGTPTGFDRVLGLLSVRIARNPVPLLAVALLVALVGVAVDPSIPIDTDMASFVPPDMPAQIELNKVTSAMGSTSPVPIYVTGRSVDSLDSLAWMRAFEEYALENHGDRLTGGISIADIVMLYNGGALPATASELRAVLDAIPARIKGAYLSGNGEAQISFSSIYMEMDQQNELKAELNGDLAYIHPPAGIEADPNGSFALWTQLIDDIANFKDSMTVLGFVLVLATLLAVYRKIDAAAPLIPIVAVVGWNSVTMALLGIDYTILTATLGAMTIGVAAEYTILVLERYLEEREKTGDVYAAIERSVQRIGRAIAVSGLATAAGFSALLISSFPIIANFGITTVIAVGYSLIGTIAVMPAALSLVDWLRQRTADSREDRSGAST